MKRRPSFLLALSLAWLAPALCAHDGPPFPIVVDEPVGRGVLSIWADPDVGTGTFYFYLDEREGLHLPDVQLAVRPLDEERAESSFSAHVPRIGAPYDLVAEVDFDHRGPWLLRVLVDDQGQRRELELDIEVTPPGLGRIDLLLYLSPFLALGALWLKAVLSQRSARPRAASGRAAGVSTSPHGNP